MSSKNTVARVLRQLIAVAFTAFLQVLCFPQQRMLYHERANSSPAIISANSLSQLSLPKANQPANHSSQSQFPQTGPVIGGRNYQISHYKTPSEGTILDQGSVPDWMSLGNQSLARDGKYGGHSSGPAPLRAAVSSDEILSSRRIDTRYTTDYELLPFPKGWELAYTAAGEKFFINHNNKTTTWYDPRIPEELQRQRILQQHSIANRVSSSGNVNMPGTFCHQPTDYDQQLSLSQPYSGLTQQRSLQQQPAQAGQLVQDLPVFCEVPYSEVNYQQNANVQRPIGATFSPSGTQQRVNQLAQEVHSYKIRQREILEQGLLPTECGLQQAVSYNPTVATPYQTNINVGYDMYQHGRQESNDSGFGANVGYSMPQTPENLSAMEISGMDFQPAMEEDIYPTLPTVINDLDQYLNIR